jgi:hypothetical protein
VGPFTPPVWHSEVLAHQPQARALVQAPQSALALHGSPPVLPPLLDAALVDVLAPVVPVVLPAVPVVLPAVLVDGPALPVELVADVLATEDPAVPEPVVPAPDVLAVDEELEPCEPLQAARASVARSRRWWRIGTPPGARGNDGTRPGRPGLISGAPAARRSA